MIRASIAELGNVLAFVRWIGRSAPRLARLMPVLIALFLFANLLSLISLVPLLGLLDPQESGGKVGELANFIVARGAAFGVSINTTFLLTAYLLSTVLAVLARYHIARHIVLLREACLLQLRSDAYEAVQVTRWQAQALVSPADGNRVLTEEAGRTAYAIELLFRSALEAALLAFLILVGLWLAWWVVSLAVLGGLAIFLVLTPLRQWTLAAGTAVSSKIAEFHRLATALLGSGKELRAHGLHDKSADALISTAYELGQQHYRQRRMEAATFAGFTIGAELLIVGFVIAFMWSSGSLGSTLLLLLYCAGRGFTTLGRAHNAWVGFLAHLPSFTRTRLWLRSLEIHAEDRAPPQTALAAKTGAARVQLTGATVEYVGADRPALDNVTLHIDPGEMVAFMGASGSGKTTLADLCAGLLRPDRGSCEVSVGDGHLPVIGYVGQEGLLLPMTIRENLLWHRPDASEEQCRAALALADSEFVFELSNGLDTRTGEGVSRFSGGQKMRLALACALVRDPAILILDETTSQLDATSESRILDMLVGLAGTCTIVIVTHRESTASKCDRCIFLNQGQLARKIPPRTLADNIRIT